MEKYIERCDTISKYFNEVRESKLISIEKEVELSTKIVEGDTEAIDELVKANLKFVISIAKEYQGLGLPLPDLISEGNYGLIKSASKFDPTRGYRFISYAVWWIRQSIIQSLNDNSRIIRLPINIINKLSQLNKKSLTYEEIMNGDGQSEVHYPTCVSINEPTNYSGDMEIIDFLSDDVDDDSEVTDIEVDKLRRVINNTLEILDDRERGIVECYFGLNRDCEPMTLEAIGDEYGLTKERIRQIKHKAIRRLKHNNEELYLLLNR